MCNRLLENEDKRDQRKVKHSIYDCFMSCFAMMFFQDSFLMCFQREWNTKIRGRKPVYEWINVGPLNGYNDRIWVNYFEYKIIGEEKVNYQNSWIIDITLSRDNIEHLVRGGRSRWKIENETFNTLKNKRYHLEHNFGHGKKNISIIFFLLNLLVFFVHQILELTDLLYQKCRAKFSSLKKYWNYLRVTFQKLLFESWEEYLGIFYFPP